MVDSQKASMEIGSSELSQGSNFRGKKIKMPGKMPVKTGHLKGKHSIVLIPSENTRK